MGASSSVLEGEINPDELAKITDNEKVTLKDVSKLLKAYQIKSDSDIAALDEKYQSLKAEGSHGFSLLHSLHDEAHSIANEKQPGDAFAAVVDQARERVRVLMRQVSQEKFVNFMVGLDGSKPSDNAYEVCLQELIKSRDGVIGLHCFDTTKTNAEIDPAHKPEALREKFDVDLTVRSNKGRYKLLWVNKHGQRTDTFLLKTVATFLPRLHISLFCRSLSINDICMQRDLLDYEDRPSYFVTGITGRKEVKDKNKVGTLPMLAAGQFLIPNIIIKKEPILDRPRIFVCAIKSCEHVEPYDLCLDLAKPGNGDKVFILHIYKDDASNKTANVSKLKEFDEFFSKRIKEDGLDVNGSKFMPIANSDNLPAHDIVLKQLVELEADYVLIYPHIMVPGAAAANNCNLIIEQAECNVVVCRR